MAVAEPSAASRIMVRDGFNTTSDATLKNVLQEQRDFRTIIENVWVGDAEWKASPGSRELIILAQQTYEFYPQAITKPANDADHWHADYSKLAPLALWGVKDLYKITETHTQEIARLRNEVADLRAQLERKAA